MLDISVDEFTELNGSEYLLIDIRDENAFSYGSITGSRNIPKECFDSGTDLPKDKKLVICSEKGDESREIVKLLQQIGYEAYNLAGGYAEWLERSLDGKSRASEIEKSIQKKFHKVLWSRFAKAICTYELVNPGDKIAVCISGGKDSMLMAKLFQELKRHDKFPFEVCFIVMDPGYSPENRRIIEKNAQMMGIPITIFDSDIFDAVYTIENSPCYLCARMRRGYLYNKAKELGCNKIALGHHYDDVIETILMSVIYGGQIQTMMPKLHSTNFEGMQLIRPMYFIREKDIIHWKDYNDLRFIQCACRFTEACAARVHDGNGNSGSKRLDIKHLIAKLAEENPQIEHNIFRSVEGVNLSTVISYKKEGVIRSFMDDYEN